jgi:hypothetical protein
MAYRKRQGSWELAKGLDVMFKVETRFVTIFNGQNGFEPFRDISGYHFERHIILVPYFSDGGSSFSVEIKDKVEACDAGGLREHKFVVVFHRMDYLDRHAPSPEVSVLMRNLACGDLRGVAAEVTADALFFAFCNETVYKEFFPKEYVSRKKFLEEKST